MGYSQGTGRTIFLCGVAGYGSADKGPRLFVAAGMGVGGEGTGPGDVAMASGIEGVAAFVECPAGAGVNFAEGEIVGGNVLLGAGEAFFGNGELIHESEAEVVFFGGEIDFGEAAAESGGGFPTDLASEAGLIARGVDILQVVQEVKENGFEEVPIFGAGGEEGTEPEDVGFGTVDVKGGEVALTGGGDVETEAKRWIVGLMH